LIQARSTKVLIKPGTQVQQCSTTEVPAPFEGHGMLLIPRAKLAITTVLHRLARQRPRMWLTVSVLVSLGLVAYSQGTVPGHYLAAPLALGILYLNITLLYLRIQIERNSEIKSRADRWTASVEKALEAERAERAAEFARRDSKWYQTGSRVLEHEDERLFCSVWGEALGVTVSESHLRYLQNRISHIEDSCQGRLAGSVQDAILRILVACSISDEHLCFLEIGTLYGVNAIILYDIASCLFERVTFTVIDPLDGYYAPGNLDANTGMPVNRKILQRNLDHLMVPPDDYRIIQQYSSSPSAVRLAGEQSYNLVFIDGDHSYEGVKTDFEAYSGLLGSRGYLVFDDYQTTSWPGVERAVDEVVLTSPLYERIGASWRSIVFRKK
jgi:hypothetical protein